ILSILRNDERLNSQEPLDGGGELFYLLVGILPMLCGLPDAVFDMVLEEYGAYLLQGRNHTGDLGQDVYAVGVLVHHPLYAPHLALDPSESILEQLFVLGLYVAVGGSLCGSRPLASLCRVHHLLLSLHFSPAQPEGIAQHRHTGERHRRGSQHGVEEAILPEHRAQHFRHAPVGEERIENPCCYGNERDIVGEGPEQVLLDVPHRGFRETDGLGHPAYVARDERHVCSLHSDVGAGTYCYTYVGLCQGRGVVDAIADHADLLALSLQPLDLVRLVLGPDLRHDTVYAELPRDRLCGATLIPGQHGDLEPYGVQPPYRVAGPVAHHVRHRHEAGGHAVHRNEDGSLAFPR